MSSIGIGFPTANPDYYLHSSEYYYNSRIDPNTIRDLEWSQQIRSRTEAQNVRGVWDKKGGYFGGIDAEGVRRSMGGPIYAYRGYDVAEQDAYDIEDPNTDLSSGWIPSVVPETGGWDAGDEALMQNYEMLGTSRTTGIYGHP